MANYLEMNREELTAEKAKLNEQYKKFLAMNLKLNMARGKPGPHQMDLAMGLLQMNDYTTDAGTDARNYGDLEGLHEARVLFADVFGVKPEEVFVGGNSSLQLMYNLINIGYVFGFPESPCPWSQVEKRKFLCPVPGYDRHFAITEEFGFELVSVPMTPNGPDMEIVEKHHNLKVDAPSGTALALADSINEEFNGEYEYVYDRSNRREQRPKKEIGISSVRGGTIVGDHDVIFAGADEVVTFSHTAYSKAVFGKGAVQAAKFLAGKPAGMYNMSDVINAAM